MKWTRLGRTKDCSEGIARFIHHEGELHIWSHGTPTLKQWKWNFDLRTKHGWNIRDMEQAKAIWNAIHNIHRVPLHRIRTVHLYGFSRGGGVSVQLYDIYSYLPVKINISLYSPKRTGWAAPKHTALVTRGDIVPFLPPIYKGYDRIKIRKLTWPWKAHKEMMRIASKVRTLIPERVGRILREETYDTYN